MVNCFRGVKKLKNETNAQIKGSFKYTEIQFNIDDVSFSLHYSHSFNTYDALTPIIDDYHYHTLNELMPSDLHVHPYCEIFFPDSEAFEVIFENERVTVDKCSALLVPSGVKHTASRLGAESAICIIFSFTKNVLYSRGGLYDIMTDAFMRPYLLAKAGRPFFDNVVKLYEYLDVGNVVMTARYFHDILTDVLDTVTNIPHRAPENMLPDSNIRRGRRLSALIGAYCCDDCSLPFLASQMQLSVRQTTRLIRALYGKPLGEILLEYRMKGAAAYLCEGNLTVAEIAVKVGYNSLSCFYTAFKKYYSCLPKEYKAKYNTHAEEQ